jgi:hypothetical protein
MEIHIEMTDTFQGEANYGWVTAASIKISGNESHRTIVRRAKKRLEISHLRHDCEDYGDMIKLKIRKHPVVVFITW